MGCLPLVHYYLHSEAIQADYDQLWFVLFDLLYRWRLMCGERQMFAFLFCVTMSLPRSVPVSRSSFTSLGVTSMVERHISSAWSLPNGLNLCSYSTIWPTSSSSLQSFITHVFLGLCILLGRCTNLRTNIIWKLYNITTSKHPTIQSWLCMGVNTDQPSCNLAYRVDMLFMAWSVWNWLKTHSYSFSEFSEYG